MLHSSSAAQSRVQCGRGLSGVGQGSVAQDCIQDIASAEEASTHEVFGCVCVLCACAVLSCEPQLLAEVYKGLDGPLLVLSLQVSVLWLGQHHGPHGLPD